MIKLFNLTLIVLLLFTAFKKRSDGSNKIIPLSPQGFTVAGGNGLGSAANQFNETSDIFVDASGNIYVSDFHNHRIQKWAPGATTGTTVAGGNGLGSAANQFNYPEGIFVDTSGNIYIADTYNHRIQKWSK